MADRLCSEYPFMPGDQLLVEGRSWLRRVGSFQGQRLTLNQHREILTLAGRHNSSAGQSPPNFTP